MKRMKTKKDKEEWEITELWLKYIEDDRCGKAPPVEEYLDRYPQYRARLAPLLRFHEISRAVKQDYDELIAREAAQAKERSWPRVWSRFAPEETRTTLQQAFQYLIQGKLRPAAARFERAINLTPDNPRGYYGRAIVAFWQGDLKSAQTYYEHSLEAARKNDDAFGCGLSYTALGHLYLRQGAYEPAIEMYQAAGQIAERFRITDWQARLAASLGVGYLEQRDWVKAREILQSALDLAQKVGDTATQAASYTTLGTVFLRQGDLAQAEKAYAEADRLFDQLRQPPGQMKVAYSLGYLAQVKQDWTTAQKYYQSALALARKLGDRTQMTLIYGALGNLAVGQGRTQKAVKQYRSAAQAQQRITRRPARVKRVSQAAELKRRVETLEQLLMTRALREAKTPLPTQSQEWLGLFSPQARLSGEQVGQVVPPDLIQSRPKPQD